MDRTAAHVKVDLDVSVGLVVKVLVSEKRELGSNLTSVQILAPT